MIMNTKTSIKGNIIKIIFNFYETNKKYIVLLIDNYYFVTLLHSRWLLIILYVEF